MAGELITQGELATIVDVSAAYISKLKKKDVFEGCWQGKKLLKKLALQAYYDNEDPKRESQRTTNEQNRNGDEGKGISPAKKDDDKKKKSFGMFDVSYLGDDAQQELNELTSFGKTAVQKIQIKDAFLDSKSKELEFKKELGVLIELEQAEALIELVATNMKTKMYDTPHLLKSKFPSITKPQVEHLYGLIDLAFSEFHKYGLESDE